MFKHIPVFIPEIKDITNDNGTRFYTTPEGKEYPSVTTVLAQHSAEGIAKWRKKVGNFEADRISLRGRERGTKFHLVTEAYLKNDGYEAPSTILERDSFSLVIPYLKKINHIRCQEGGLWSDHLRMAGRVDCVADYDGKRSIIDFKTARKRKQVKYIENYFMQTTAYSIMFEERTGIVVPNLVVIISVDGDFPQVFIEHRDKWVKPLIHYRDKYYNDRNNLVRV